MTMRGFQFQGYFEMACEHCEHDVRPVCTSKSLPKPNMAINHQSNQFIRHVPQGLDTGNGDLRGNMQRILESCWVRIGMARRRKCP